MAQLKDLIVNGPSRFIGDVYATTFTGNLEGNASTATNATNAGMIAGLSVHSGRNNEANKIVRTDGNGYLQVGYINSSSGHEKNASNPTYVWGSNSSDSYLRSYQTSSLSVKYATTSGSCSGNAATATKATQDGNGNVITSTYLPLADKGLSNGKVPYYVNFPDYKTLVSLGYNEESTKTSDEYYFKGLCKWAIDNFAGQEAGQIILIGNAIPNSGGFCCIQLYSTGGKDATTGLPRYCSGTYISLDRVTTNFSCTNYIWTFGGRFYGNASSSSKWATPRTITLTGSVTGSVSIDGSANVSLATTTNHTHNYLPLSGGTISDSATTLVNFNSTGSESGIRFQLKNVSKGWAGYNNTYGTHLFIYADSAGDGANHTLGIRCNGNGYIDSNTILHSGNYNSYALPLSGGTMANTNVVTNLNADLLDGYHKSSIFISNFSAIPSSKLNTYATRQSGTYTVNYQGYTKTLVTFRNIGSTSALELLCEYNNSTLLCRTAIDSNRFTDWKTIAFTDSNISGNAATATNADKLDGYHKTDILRRTNAPTSVISLNDVVTEGIDFTSWAFAQSANVNNQPGGNGASSAASVVSFGTHYPFQIYSDYNNTSLLYYRSFYGNTGWKVWRQFAFTDSNVASATKLQNSRTIWGQSFDGTGNVSGALTGVTTITTSGQICINTSSSQANNYNEGIRCNLGGSSNWASVVLGGASGSTNGTGSGVYSLLVNSSLFRIRQNSTEVLCINTSNNVGIGTTSPSYKLHVVGTAYASGGLVSDGPVKVNESFIVDGTNGSWYGKLNIADEVYILGEDTNINFIESLNIKQHNTTNNTETSIVSIDNSGNITLNVMNDNGGSYEISTKLGSLGIGIPSDDPNLVKTPSFLMSNQGYIYLNARVPSSPNYPLVVNGTIQCTTLSQTSDIKYKSNIKQIEYEEALKIIENLNPVTWDWNENTVETGSSSGFVAQEAEEFIPNAISRDNENNLSLDYTQLHSYEIRVIQEQQKEIIKLKEKLKILENLIS